MVSHIAFDGLPMSLPCFVFCHPFKCLFEEVLTNGCSVYKVFAQTSAAAVCLRKVLLCVRHERACKDGVVYFLVVQDFSGNVDGLEPVQLLACIALAYIYLQLVVEDFLLYVCGLVVEVLEVVGEVSCHIFAKRKGALLAVHDFIGAFGIIAAFYPIHHVQGIAVQNGCNDGLLLLLVVDKFALVGRANVEQTAKTTNSQFFVIYITLDHLADSYIHFVYCHHSV